MFKFYLNNQLVSDPLNWKDFTETIERDDVIKGLLPKYEIKLKFNAGGFDYLMSQVLASGFCGLVELRVDYKCAGGNYSTILNAYIFLTECKFNLNKCIVECEVEDNNYGARIYRNKSIKVYLNTDKTKNGEDLTLCNTSDIQFFVPNTGTYSGSLRTVYTIKDVFRFLVEFMTDNLVGFESDFLDTVDVNGLSLITGDGIRTPSANSLSPFVSFEEVFTEVNKKYPIAFTIITGSDGRPTMKIEEEAYFYSNTDSITIENIEDLSQSFNNEILYSSVKFGGQTVTFNAAIHHFGYIRFLAFKEEQYFLQGECNIDKTLDLFGNFICDSNIIEELFTTATSNDSYDEDTFFIQTDTGAQAERYENPTTGGTPYYYNGTLTNDKVSERYNYNGSLALYLSGAIIGFRASKNIRFDMSAQTLAAAPGTCSTPPASRAIAVSGVYVSFEDDTTSPNFDTAGNYDVALDRYTASVAGEYVFETAISYSTFPLGGFNFNMYYKAYVEFRRFNSGGTLMQSSQTEDPINPSGFYSSTGDHSIFHSAVFTLDVGDYVRVAFWYSYASINCTIDSSIIVKQNAGINNTYFRTIASPTSGGVYQETNTAPYRASKFEFEQPLSKDKYDALKADLSKGIGFNYKPLTNKRGWLRRSERNFATSHMTWELISNITNSQ